MAIPKLTAGDNQISAKGWNDIRSFIHDFTGNRTTIQALERNPVYVTVHNTSSNNLTAFSVVKIVEGTYQNREVMLSADDEGVRMGVEVDVEEPDSVTDNIAILQQSIQAGGYGKAIVNGCTYCRLWIDDEDETYTYAEPNVEESEPYSYEELHAVKHVTNIKILWHSTPDNSLAYGYVTIGEYAESPFIVADSMISTSPETPASGDTSVLYQSSASEFDEEAKSGFLYVNNPLGLPAGRPWAVTKVNGFPNGVTDIPDYTAIGCDCREFFTVPASSAGGINAGDVYNIGHGSSSSTSNAWTVTTSAGGRLAISQISTPSGFNKDVRVPFYSPESNMGYEAKRNSNVTEGCRCGVLGTDHEFTLNRFDYLYIKGKYVYDPVFLYVTKAKAGSSSGVYISINNQDFQVTFSSSFQYPSIAVPDIYADDEITVLVDASSSTPTIKPVTYPTDYATGTILGGFSTPGRGWTEYTSWKSTGNDFIQVMHASSNYIYIPKTISGASVTETYSVNQSYVKFWIKDRTSALLNW